MSESKHAANHDGQWLAKTCEPDFCRVGKKVIGFNSFAWLDTPVKISPNVLGNGLYLYRKDDLFKIIQADAGRHVVAGTSLGIGHVKILQGHDNVKVNGIPVARHDSPCRINCNAAGVGGAKGYLITAPKPLAGGRSTLGGTLDEAGKVLEDSWDGLKDSAKTLWDALPFTADDAATQAARSKIADGITGTAQTLGTLMGPPPEMVQGAYLSGNAESIALVEQMQADQQELVGVVADHVGDSVKESYQRNGVAGAAAMVLTSLGVEVVGGKGLGALGKVSHRIAQIAKLAKTPMEAAKLLDKEIEAARLAGKADEVALLEKARKEALEKARKDAAKSDDGVHVKRPETKVPCFHPFDKKKFTAMTPDGQKAYLKEMADQLKRQQDQINSLSAIDYKAARDAFANTKAMNPASGGRNPLADKAQESYRRKFADSIEDSIGKSLKNGGMGAAQAEIEAAARTKEVMGKLAALHDPDMVAGGWMQPDPKGMGRADVNSSIGSSWNQEGRVASMDQAADDAIKSGRGNETMNVKLEPCRGKGLK